MCRKRSDSEGDYSRRVKNQMLIEMDNNLNSEKRCILLCATNCPWDLDVAFMRRFQCRVFLPLPDKSARLKILRDQCKGVDTSMSDDEWETIASSSEGYSGADLTNLAMFAIQEPLDGFRYNQPTVSFNQLPQASGTSSIQAPPLGHVKIRDVNFEDFKKALQTTPKSVTSSELGKFHIFMEQSG
uniref:Katanin p60 ATPase-containing subunit A1 n=2 Tax=Lygus hesperus TaxID=30085 RepID=A0A0A9YIP7_LYGHE